MTLLITAFAAVIATVAWYKKAPDNTMKLSMLCFMYWGATLMWLVDAVIEYIELGAEFFAPAAADMLNDTYLGFSVVALGLVAWVITLLVKDPKGVLSTVLQKKD